MSTSLWSLAIVVLAIGASLSIALGEPDQPATLRRVGRRGRPPRPTAPRPPAASAPAAPAGHARATPTGGLARSLRTTAGSTTLLLRSRLAARAGTSGLELTNGSDGSAVASPGPAQLAEQWVLTAPPTLGQRIRSALVLAVIVGVMGTVVAVAFSAMAVLVALVFQRVVG